MITHRHTIGEPVEVPASATKMADVADKAGWSVAVVTAQGPAYDSSGELQYVTETEQDSEESGGKNHRVKTDEVRTVESVSVRCRRGRDYIYFMYLDGKFDHACRPWAMQVLGSTAGKEHLLRPLDVHRFVSSNHPGILVCQFHGERKPVHG